MVKYLPWSPTTIVHIQRPVRAGAVSAISLLLLLLGGFCTNPIPLFIGELSMEKSDGFGLGYLKDTFSEGNK